MPSFAGKNINKNNTTCHLIKINQIQNLALYLQTNFNGIFHGPTQISDPMALILVQPLAYPV